MPWERDCHKESTSSSLFDCFGKKEEKLGDDKVITDLKTGQVSKPDKMEEKHTLMEELHQTRSNSSLSSDEEEQEGGEKKRKKGLKEEVPEHKDASVSKEKCDQEEKKRNEYWRKEKQPGYHKNDKYDMKEKEN
ncbi:hypothetical protein Acr_09g0009740 [Actinidia rufa]|uniref:Uncharacterized protein n=1 Tax=Actinidia rufa TaxID=165716 RepID=A0A7J0F754_9ERIC|nr:hypothetical protein Acr_09g0009740 [Actinidia rufa]